MFQWTDTIRAFKNTYMRIYHMCICNVWCIIVCNKTVEVVFRISEKNMKKLTKTENAEKLFWTVSNKENIILSNIKKCSLKMALNSETSIIIILAGLNDLIYFNLFLI